MSSIKKFKPFSENLYYLLIIWALSSSAAVWYWFKDGNWIQGVDLAARGFIVSFIITLICGFFKGAAERIAKILFFLLGVVNLVIDKGVYNICHLSFSWDAVGIIMGTNAGEAKEFIGMYMTPKVLAFILIVLALCAVFFVLRKWIAKLGSAIWWICASLLVVSIVFVSCNKLAHNQLESSRWDSVFVCKAHLFMTYDRPVDLTEYRTSPKVSISGKRPKDVVIIIGESVSRSHFSLYGYEKKTTPHLEIMYEKDSLICFKDAQSAYVSTANSFKRMMNKPAPEGKKWYESATVFDYLKAGGYHTEWISNQSSSGMIDNVVASYANLADTARWVGAKGLGVQKKDFDELLIPELADAVRASKDSLNFYFVHMMGCHESFYQRYPASYSIFSEDDYPERPESQRTMVSQYDNALLYGDMVIASLMDVMKNEESVVMFFPDHGLDVYESDASYIGHARVGDETSMNYGRSIPLVIYASSAYRGGFPDDYSELQVKADQAFNTENLIQFVSWLCHIVEEQ